jgi:Na+-translocating ferredoxin:NAD+ oxidoreductase RnfE subunit
MRLRIITGALFLLLGVAPALAQGCAMCYSTAAAASKDGQRAINRAVLVLLVPPVGFMTLGIGMAMRYSHKRDEEADRTDS